MADEKFNPAPADKHADTAAEAVRADKQRSDRVERGSEGSFPASDPVSAAQPAKSKSDRQPVFIETDKRRQRH